MLSHYDIISTSKISDFIYRLNVQLFYFSFIIDTIKNYIPAWIVSEKGLWDFVNKDDKITA